MRILVLSDSHAALSFMRLCVARFKPDAVVHLGDHYDDGEVLAEENRHLIVHQVPGNCDRGRCRLHTPQILDYPVGGVRLYMTHGHKHGVKSGTYDYHTRGRIGGTKIVISADRKTFSVEQVYV